MELSFFRIVEPPFAVVRFRELLAQLMAHKTSPWSSSAMGSVMYLATTSVPAMISSFGNVFGVIVKYKTLLSIDCSSLLICLQKPEPSHVTPVCDKDT